jgi:Tfp pilus assembly protein FimV
MRGAERLRRLRRQRAGPQRAGRGEHCSHVCVPPLFSPLRSESAQPGGAIKGAPTASELESRAAHRARRIVRRAALDLVRTGPLSRRTTAAGNLTGTNRSDGYM